IEKYNHLLATNKKIPIPNITFIIRNNFGEIAKSKRVVAQKRYIIIALNLIQKFEDNKNKLTGVFSASKVREKYLFDKNKIVEQLKQRVENLRDGIPKNNLFPKQGPTSLCGPAAFFYCLLVDRPDLYVKCVIDLWERGEANIKNLHIKPSNDCKNPSSKNGSIGNINGVDWITLASLRDSENSIFDYDEADDQLAGITFEGKLKSWFIKVGAELLFSNITYGLHINKNKLLQLV
ncbi:hypothetical protein CQA53_11790, partial [Helicobacter didelphidarum]